MRRTDLGKGNVNKDDETRHNYLDVKFTKEVFPDDLSEKVKV